MITKKMTKRRMASRHLKAAKKRKGQKFSALPLLFVVFFTPSCLSYFLFPAIIPLPAAKIVKDIKAPIAVAEEKSPSDKSLEATPVVILIPDADPVSVVPDVVAVVPKAKPKISEAHLEIPSLKINAVIKDMGFTSAGAMAVPNNGVDVGWFSPGTRPGATGSAVIGAHNDWGGGAGVFNHLNLLQIGDTILVTDANGVPFNFVVTGIRLYDPTDNGKTIFDSASGAHLNLITCDGVWDRSTKSFSKRLVIFTDLYTPVI